jgi:hypothetical protein
VGLSNETPYGLMRYCQLGEPSSHNTRLAWLERVGSMGISVAPRWAVVPGGAEDAGVDMI